MERPVTTQTDARVWQRGWSGVKVQERRECENEDETKEQRFFTVSEKRGKKRLRNRRRYNKIR
jgi:hypothetical protein